MVAIWAFGVRGSGESVTVRIPESGDAAEYRWASRICAAISDWDRSWVKTVVEPTAPGNQGNAPIGPTIDTMRRLIDRLRTDIDAIDPPTDRAREAQDSIATTPRVEARELAQLKPDFSLDEFAVFHIWTRAAALNYLARSYRVQTLLPVKAPTLLSPYIGLALADAPGCDEVPLLPRLPEWR